jgi:hypothetical protein
MTDAAVLCVSRFGIGGASFGKEMARRWFGYHPMFMEHKSPDPGRIFL